MKLIAQAKLQPTEEQAQALLDTIETANAACNFISNVAWETETFYQFALHKLTYYPVREKFDLSAQVTVRQIAKVADAYKLDRKRKRRFRKHGSIAYDKRILSWRLKDNTINIWTMKGRQRIPFVCGPKQQELLKHRFGEADLIYRNGKFFLHQVCEIVESDEYDPTDWLGIDLGIVNLATDSDSTVFSGEQTENKRRWYENRRAVLQSVGTKSAKRRLKQMSGRQSRFQKDTNHVLSKTIVVKAQRTHRGIAMEDLSGIRNGTRVRKSQRSRHSNWSFYQLKNFVTYKAKLHGVPFQLVDPRNTSKTCSVCGYCDKANRLTRDDFLCKACGFSAPADMNAAVNVAARAVSTRPVVSTEMAKGTQLSIAPSLEVRDKLTALAVSG